MVSTVLFCVQWNCKRVKHIFHCYHHCRHGITYPTYGRSVSGHDLNQHDFNCFKVEPRNIVLVENQLTLGTKWPPFPGQHFQLYFLEWKLPISVNTWQKFVPKVPINSIQTLVQIMTWHRPGAKPLSEPMMLNLLTHICVTRLQWVYGLPSQQIYLKSILRMTISFGSCPRFATIIILMWMLAYVDRRRLLKHSYQSLSFLLIHHIWLTVRLTFCAGDLICKCWWMKGSVFRLFWKNLSMDKMLGFVEWG